MEPAGHRPNSGKRTRGAPVPLLAAASAVAALLLPCASAADVPQNAAPVRDGVAKVADVSVVRQPQPEPRKPDLIVVPIPQSSPSLGTGITLGGGVFYNPNGSKEPWTSGAALMATSNGSWAIGGGHKMYLDRDRFKVTLFAAYADVNLRFYGIGSSAGDNDRSVTLNERGVAAFAEPQIRIARNLYVGMRALYLDVNTSVLRDRDEGVPPDVELPTREFESRLAQLGLLAAYDSRDNALSPRRGVYAQASWMHGVPALGSDFSNDRLTAYANVYRPLGPDTVFAARVSGCAVSDGTPFYDICLYGASSDLRGYETGRYRDRLSWATQAEVRQAIKGRIGVAAFAGVGGIARSFDDLGNSTVLPAIGAGLRIRASKETPINLRIDYAVGKDSNAFYISLGEAF